MIEQEKASSREFATLAIDWEQSDLPADRPVAVQISFTPAAVSDSPESRLPLNLGLSIDRSGSMDGDKLAAARKAGVGVLESLADGERFAAVAFDGRVEVVTPSIVLDAASRARVAAALGGIDSRGSTALFDGFRRAAELVAEGGAPDTSDSWVIVLSDGQGNQGIVDPVSLRRHAAALAERGIRAITVGIGADYEASQLTALADGGCGEFHHASHPGEIIEIVLGELGALRNTAARDLRFVASVNGVERCLLLGGDARSAEQGGETRFDRVASGRAATAMLLLWPAGPMPEVAVDANWSNVDQSRASAHVRGACPDLDGRNVALALRAATLWQASIVARTLELNERADYQEAQRFVRSAARDLEAYARGLPGAEDLAGSLAQVGRRAGRRWSSVSHREAYNLSTKLMRGRQDLRSAAPVSLDAALAMDED